ncbi:MAG: hypothetical protein KW806_03235 [Candidatus Yanofskybacteria bacterium]|nr:hypothetical protein [Candidatus Yanofskybacteria bacterium]
MQGLRNAVLATLAYYDVFDFPLTAFEVWKYLINPARVERLKEGITEISLSEVIRELDELLVNKKILEHNGFYFFPERVGIYDTRIEREKISAQKWKKLLKYAQWFVAVPYIKGLFISGSMAVNNSTEMSDFDALVVARSGRLYTCRILLSFMAGMLGVRRTKHDTRAPDKFCFNHYVTDHNLGISYESLYNAQSYTSLRPILVRDDIWVKFFRENIWLHKFVYNAQPEESYFYKLKPWPLLEGIRGLAEAVLDTVVGEWLEKFLRYYQQRRIRMNPVSYAPGGRTIFTDAQLEFHPHSEERRIITRYNETVLNLGTFWNYAELDSGLE